MKKSKIYTKTGDMGQTGLVSGNRTAKSDVRIDLYGDLDELNSRIGFACSLLDVKKFKLTIEFLYEIQSSIFDLSSNLACEAENRIKFKLPQVPAKLIEEIEKEIDLLDQDLAPLKNFILPGGSMAAAALHLCRTGTRSVERKLFGFHETVKEDLPVNGLVFLNRLSDYFFVLARSVNREDESNEIPWRANK